MQEPEIKDGEKVCPVCGSGLKMIQAGTSKKTGKPYNAFYACKDYDCKYTFSGDKTGVSTSAGVQPSTDVAKKLDDISMKLSRVLDILGSELPKEDLIDSEI